MTSFTKRNSRLSIQAGFERRYRWNRALLMGSTGLGGVLAGLALGAGSAWGQIATNTLPTGGTVTAGSATINQANPTTLNINQTTNRAVINWNSFDVGANASVNFYQPNSGSWTLNRVTNSIAPSMILGHITANGNIAVINSNGVIFGPGSRVDVNGLVATTANISNTNFMSGNMTFDQAGNPTATVSNFGDITVKDAGLVAFVAPGVQNAGTINARLGKVSLAAGQKFTLDLYGDKLVSIAADGAVTQAPIGPNGQMVAALVDNSGKIVAEGGQIQITAKQATRLVDNAINMSGVVQAQSAYVAQNGDIVLDAGPAGNVVVSGTLDASGKGAGQTGGNITVTGKDDIRVTETAKLDASGYAGGGKIKIGGDYKGGGTTPTAKRTLVATGAQINADAINSGNGGTIIVWSDENTMVGGILSVQGGIVSGNGGLIETSSKGDMTIAASTDIRLNAPNGIGGQWLLDPRNITIVSAGGSAGAAGTVAGNDQFSDSPQNSNNILDSVINTALTSGSVTLQATNNITMNAGTTISNATAGRNLTLQAGNDLTINGVITLAGSFSGTANDSSAGTSFPGGGPNGDANSVGRADSNTGDIVVAGSITATAITLTIDPSTATITYNSNGPRAYNPGSVSITGTLAATATTTGNIVINATSTASNFTAASGSVIRANNNIAVNIGGSATLSANLVPDFDVAGGGTLSGTAPRVFITNNTAQVQDGIDIAATGGTITLAAATTWAEAININKSLNLFGTSGTSTIDASATTATAIATINAAGNVEIGGIKFVGDNSQTNGIFVTTVAALNFHDSNVTGVGTNFTANAIKVDAATAGVTINNGTLSGAAGDGINIDPAGPIVITNMVINNMAGDGIEVTGTTAPATISIANNAINNVGANGIFVHDNAVPGTISIVGNSIANSGTIGLRGILVLDNAGYTVGVSTNNVGTGGVVGGDGIFISNAASVSVGSNIIGSASANNITNTGIRLDSITNATLTSNVINRAQVDGIEIDRVSNAILTNNSVLFANGAGVGSVGLDVTNQTGITRNISLIGNTISFAHGNAVQVVDDEDSSGATPTSLFFGAGNVLQGNSAGTNALLFFKGADTRITGNSLNDTTLLGSGGTAPTWFVQLSNGALFKPGSPTFIDAGNVRFDLNGNGVIDANEQAVTDFNGATITTQAALDAAWAPGGVFDTSSQIEAKIFDYRDLNTLGRISPLGPVTVVYSNTDFGGGLLGIQNAINITPTSGFVFVNSGTFGETEPGGADATTPLTINKALTVVGRQGFTSAATGGRTEGGAGESILDFAALSAAVTGGVTISASNVTLRGFDIRMDTDQVAGVSIGGTNRTNIVVTDNFIHGNSGNGIETAGGANLTSGNFNGNSIHNIGDTGIQLQLSSGASNFTISDNRIVAGTDPSDNGIQIDAVFGAGTNLTVAQNFIEGAGGNGIIVSNFNKVTITQNTIASTAVATVGGDAIRVVAPQSGSVYSNNVIATGAGNQLSVTGAGIHILNESGNQTVQNNSIGQAGSGIWIDNASSGTNRVSIIGNTIDGVTSAGVTVSNSSGNDITVFIGTTTIKNVQSATGYGIDVIDDNAGGLTTLTFGTGDTIDSAANGIRFDGADTRVTGQTFGDIVIGSTIGSVAALPGQFFIDLRNQALYGTGAAFTPLQYDVSGVTFNSVLVSTLNPEFYDPSVAVDSDREVLAQLEAKIHHYFDDPTLGFIRLKPNSITLDPTVGLNGVQLAITVSSKVNVDTLYLLPGTYGDASDLLNNVTLGTNGALLVDRNIKIIGAQGPRDTIDGTEDGLFQLPGVSAKTGGRNFADPTTETILDFNNATVTGSSQGGIFISGTAGTTSLGTVALVSIDGVDIQLGTDDTFGIRIDSGTARSNITLVNNFVLGIPGRINGSLIDNAPGSALLTNVTIADNSIANASFAGITITNAVGVAVQNNSVQYVGADGIAVTNSHFSTSVSGNMVDSTGLNGILLTGRNDTVGNDVTVQANVVSNTGTAGGVAGDGIHVGSSGNRFNNVLVGGTGTLGNTVDSIGVGSASSGDGIEVNSAIGNVTVQGNTIANAGTIVGEGIFVIATGGSVSVFSNTLAQGAFIYNNGIWVDQTTGNVTVATNTVGNASFGTSIGNGIAATSTTGRVNIGGTTSALGNTVNNTGANGIYVQTTGNGVLAQFNTVANLANVGTSASGGNGIYILDTLGGNVTVLRNTIGNLGGGFGSQNGASFEGDGILVVGTANNVTVGNTPAGTNGNTVFNADQDGIEVRDTGLTVKVIGNVINSVGIGSTTGDGIVVTNTGTTAGSANGGVTVSTNTVTNVVGNGVADATDGLTSGDGVRISNADGNVTVRNNSIASVGDDGIQVNNVLGFTTVFLNTVSIVGTGSGNGGDGIQVNKTGRLSTYGSTIVAGGNVDVSDNTVNGTTDTGIDADDGLTAGDGIRIAHVDGTVGASSNVIASVVGGNISNDGIQVYDVTSQVFSGFNLIGSANASIGIGTNDGDGIVVENTGSYATTLGILNSGDVGISGNTIRNVVGFAIDRDGASNATVIAGSPVDFLTAGDGVRVAFADGAIAAGFPTTFAAITNSIATVGNDGIQVFYVTGQTVNGPGFLPGVNVGNNLISTVGVNTTDGDGIQVSYTGRFGGGTTAVGTTIALNAVNNVIGTGIDRDDSLTAGDGIRGSYLDGTVYVSRNQVGAAGALFALSITANTISNDGVQIWNASGDVIVTANTIGTGASIGTATNDGDGIVIENTGLQATLYGTAGTGNVIVSGNVVQNVVNVAGVGAPVLDRDGQALGTTKLTAGDGIRIAFVGGTVAVGLGADFFDGSGTVTGNSITNVNDDGIQVYLVNRTVEISNNVINSVGVLSTMGDGIVVDNTGVAGVSDNNGGVTIQHNTISNVALGSSGVGVADSDDTLSSNDGIRVYGVDGNVVIGGAGTLGNSISNTRDDGIEVVQVQRDVSVLNNRIDLVGAGSLKGDGVVVINTGTYASNPTLGLGSVTVSDNSISNVTGNGGADGDDGLSSGDGIRIKFVDGHVVFAGNSIVNTGDDGIQVYGVINTVTGTNNTITSVGNGAGLGGDGIQVSFTGLNATVFGVANAGSVTIQGNVINDVNGSAVNDADDSLTAGDGIRLSYIDGDVRVLNNTIANLAGGDINNDGIQLAYISGAGTSLTNGITISGNLVGSALATIGVGTSDGDGIQVNNTGVYSNIGIQGDGSVTISGNTVMNVTGTGATDNDDTLTANDGIRTAAIDQNVLVSGNLIDPIGDDGYEAHVVTGTVLVLGNTIDSVGSGSAWGDGIQITQVGNQFTGINVASGVTVAGNTITNVLSAGGVDPDDGRYAGDGIRITDVDGNVVVGGTSVVTTTIGSTTVTTGNTVSGISDDGIQIDVVNGEVLVSNNRVETVSAVSTEGDGIVVTNVGATFTGFGTTHNVTVVSNIISGVVGTGTDTDDGYTAGDGIRVANVAGSARVLGNSIEKINDDGVEVITVLGNVTVASNSISTIGGSSTGDGINISGVTGNVTALSNTVSNVVDLDGIHVDSIVGNVLVNANTVTSINDDGIQVAIVTGNVSVTSNLVSTIGGSSTGDGINVGNITGGVLVQSNTVSDVTDLDGIHVEAVSTTIGVNVLNNRVTRVKDDGIEVTVVTGSVSVLSNTLSTIGGSGTGDGITVTVVSGNVTVGANTVSNVTDLDGIHVGTVSGTVGVGSNRITSIKDDGVEVTVVSGPVSVLSNTITTIGGSTTGDGVDISVVSGNVVVQSNTINNVTDLDGIRIAVVSGTVSVNTNTVSAVEDNGIEIATVSGAVSVASNTLTNIGGASDGDGVNIMIVSGPVLVSANQISQVQDNGIFLQTLVGGITITNNVVSTSDIGLFVGPNSVDPTPGINVITGNSFTNNVTWGLVVDTPNTAGATILPGDTFPTLNILLKSNTFTGNGGLPDATLSQGGAILNNNLTFILDARGNNFGGIPFTTPTHFENPSTGGSGNAVSDWVRIDVSKPVVPPVPQFQLLLENFARGPHALTPGDVLAIGAGYDQNGHLFDPYFVSVFGTPFGLAGNPAGVALSIGPATDYAMCVLADMWNVTSCRIVPPPAQ